MNKFLQSLEITFRRDPSNFRPRINKLNSVKVTCHDRSLRLYLCFEYNCLNLAVIVIFVDESVQHRCNKETSVLYAASVLLYKKCPFIYRTYHTWSHGGLQFCKEPEGYIGCQLIEGASGCRLSPYVISPHPPRPMAALTTTPGTTPFPYSLRTVITL